MAYRFIKKTIYDQVRGNHLQAVQKLLSDFRNNPLWLDLSPFGPGRSAIYIAAYYNHPLMIFLLSKNGIDVDKKEHKRGETPLWMAVYWNQLDAVRALILCHANVHTSPIKGPFKNISPIEIAVKHHQKGSTTREMIQLLIRGGANTRLSGCKTSSTSLYTCS